jgi:hypothetical protein
MEKYCKLYVQSSEKGTLEEIMKSILILMSLNEKDISFYIDDNEERNKKKALIEDDGFLYYNYLIEIDSDALDINRIIEFINGVIKQLLDNRMKVVPSCDYEDKLIFLLASQNTLQCE